MGHPWHSQGSAQLEWASRGRVVGNEDMEEGLFDLPSYVKELEGFKSI